MNKLCSVKDCLDTPYKEYVDEDGDVYTYCRVHYNLIVRICGVAMSTEDKSSLPKWIENLKGSEEYWGDKDSLNVIEALRRIAELGDGTSKEIGK